MNFLLNVNAAVVDGLRGQVTWAAVAAGELRAMRIATGQVRHDFHPGS